MKEIENRLENSAKLRRLFGTWLERLVKLPSEKQRIFLGDIGEAAENRFKVLERAKN